MTEIETTVQAGIDWLDRHGPADWRDRIDRTRLKLWSVNDCPLGQLCLLGTSHLTTAARPAFFITDLGDDYDQLQAEWTRRLPEGTHS